MVKDTVLITGCSEGGIGDALAREFHRRGLRVIATARSPQKMARLRDAGIETLSLDVVDAQSVREAVDQVTKLTEGRLTYLVNNSGVGYQMPLVDADLDEARRLYEVNVWGTLGVIQAFLPLLIASSSASSGGGPAARILNIGSVTSRMSVPWQGVYNSSKAALHMLNDTLRIELAPLGVEVLHVVTGGIQTNFYANAVRVDLPAGSPYAPVKAAMEADLAGRGSKKHQSMTSDEYARSVVANALRRRPTKTLWIGGTAGLSWMGDRFLWSTMRDWIIGTFMFPMNRLRDEIQRQKQQSDNAAALCWTNRGN